MESLSNELLTNDPLARETHFGRQIVRWHANSRQTPWDIHKIIQQDVEIYILEVLPTENAGTKRRTPVVEEKFELSEVFDAVLVVVVLNEIIFKRRVLWLEKNCSFY
jgi:hypothetical protein